MVQEWTDGRLDDLSAKVDRGFEQTDRRFGKVEAEIGQLRAEMKDEFKSVRGEINGLRTEMGKTTERIDSVQRTIAFGAVALTGAILAGFAAICTLIAAAL